MAYLDCKPARHYSTPRISALSEMKKKEE